jgi:hypothetical protein
MNKALIGLICVLFLLAACDIPPAPRGEQVPVAQTPVTTPTPAHTPAPLPAPSTSTANPPNATTLGIKTGIGTLSFQSPEMKPGQWAKYKITITGDGDTKTYERTYGVVEFYHQSDSCIGIERNSTKPGEARTQTMWCDDDRKYIYVWSDTLDRFSTPQMLGSSFWSDEAIQGFETRDSGLFPITIGSDVFWSLKQEHWDGLTKETIYASPLIPGFEAGLVKKVQIVNGITTTTELVDYDGV